MHITFLLIHRRIKRTRIFLRAMILLLFAGTSVSHAQNITNSPYSRFGLGEFSPATFARNLALGGSEIGLNTPFFINYGNPASYSSLWYTTYEAGADFSQYELKDNAATHRSHTSSLAYFDFAFPIKAQKWSLAFGLLPYSKVGYSISETTSTPTGEKEVRQYQGSGGLNNFNIGSGFKIGPRASFGVNAEYLFGTINNNRQVIYESPYYFNSDISSNTSIGWFHFNTGFQYKMDSLPLAKSDSVRMMEKRITALQDSLGKLINAGGSDSSAAGYERKNALRRELAAAEEIKKNISGKRMKSDWHLVLGLVFSPSADLHATNSMLTRSFRYYSYSSPDNGTLYRDTVINSEGQESYVRLPMSAGLGFSLLKGNRWLFCADYSFQQWSKFSFLGAPDSLKNSWKATAGIQFTPNDRAIKSYWKLVQYRVGFHYEKGFLNFNGRNINEAGLSAGFGLPIRKAGSLLHLTLEAGKRGTTQEKLVQERYLKFTLGFTINDRWFVKPKYD